ncbi:hypothetical protein PDESU_05900 [Pontiella desulfatans]|uniref:Uncharacterized protein n=1 Tax=Pontiella desulfatans TaxID=2750659 RepID=A0A6C2UD51_PONDE|nr:hypothetical protein [Pontiella desulfatans]VGO17304.1 hypothetical protein PDESU_05900 [Pontiella desulfatans]
MKRNRPFLIALLIPLLLDLLVFFTVLPASGQRFQTCIEQETEEVCEGFFKAEERVEEEVEFLCGVLPPSQQPCCIASFGFSRRMFFCPSATSASLSCGWRMPLLI